MFFEGAEAAQNAHQQDAQADPCMHKMVMTCNIVLMLECCGSIIHNFLSYVFQIILNI